MKAELVTYIEYGKQLINELTEELDKHLVRPSSIGLKNYLYPYSKGIALIRYPGATRGKIELDEDGVITSIKIYEGATFIYKEEVHVAMEKFIGREIIIKRRKTYE